MVALSCDSTTNSIQVLLIYTLIIQIIFFCHIRSWGKKDLALCKNSKKAYAGFVGSVCICDPHIPMLLLLSCLLLTSFPIIVLNHAV